MKLAERLLQNAATSGNGAVQDLRGESHETAFYIRTSNATVSAGAVILETASEADYAGTWHPLEPAITPVQNTEIFRQYTGNFKFVRARISTAVTGGAAVTVRVIAK